MFHNQVKAPHLDFPDSPGKGALVFLNPRLGFCAEVRYHSATPFSRRARAAPIISIMAVRRSEGFMLLDVVLAI